MGNLRVKFLEQEYPEELIDQQFDKVRQLDREELIHRKKDKTKMKKKAREMRSCLVLTHNPANPPVHKWIKNLLNTLHEDPEMKALCPNIPIVTRQPPSVRHFALKSKHWLSNGDMRQNNQPAGCHRLHAPGKCVCCDRMEECTTSVTSTRTAREYQIRRHYNCQSAWVVYVVTCPACNIQYIGQTTQKMVERHYGHRSKVRTGKDGLGRHYLDVHGAGLNLSGKPGLAILPQQKILMHVKTS